MTSPATFQPKKRNTSTVVMFLVFGLVLLIMFDQNLRETTGKAVGYALNPVIGFDHQNPILTIFFASIILVVLTTVVRHFLTDWVNMARIQESMRAFQKEFSDARKSNNTYKLKKLTDAQPQIMELQSSMMTEQFKPMGYTMLLVIPIFAWLGTFVATLAPEQLHVIVPWNTDWELTVNWWILPRWILLYSLFGIPFGQVAQKVLKLWEYRHVDLDGDGKPAGEA